MTLKIFVLFVLFYFFDSGISVKTTDSETKETTPITNIDTIIVDGHLQLSTLSLSPEPKTLKYSDDNVNNELKMNIDDINSERPHVEDIHRTKKKDGVNNDMLQLIKDGDICEEGVINCQSVKRREDLDTKLKREKQVHKGSHSQCDGKSDGTLLPYPKNCSGFINCQSNKDKVMNCPENLVFNPSTQNCDYPRDVKPPADYCVYPDEYYYDKHYCDCNKFIVCNFGEPVELSCSKRFLPDVCKTECN